MRNRNAFTLIELILVMTILAIAVSFTAPALANFFRGRALDSEARRLLALTRQGQSRSVAEGVPMELWIDSAKGTYGLEAEPSYSQNDPKAVSITLDSSIQIEVSTLNNQRATPSGEADSGTILTSGHPNLPKIRFLPDGSFSESSPSTMRLTGRDERSLWVALARNRLNYEIQARDKN